MWLKTLAQRRLAREGAKAARRVRHVCPAYELDHPVAEPLQEFLAGEKCSIWPIGRAPTTMLGAPVEDRLDELRDVGRDIGCQRRC